MLTLNDGRSELWQWDTGRKLTVDAECSQVHFSNKVFGRSVDVDVENKEAAIPDVLLQSEKDIYAWAFVGTPENGYTKISRIFKVNRRNKPADYVFTPEEQMTIREIEAIAQSVRDDADAGLFNGENGISVTHEWKGTTLTVTSASGTSSANLKGDKGDKGDQGERGLQGIQGIRGERGEQGQKGDKGDRGEQGIQGVQGLKGETGADGFSPVVAVTDIDGGHRVTITDKNGEKAFDVMDGESGAQADMNAAEGEPGHVLNRTHWVERGYLLEETDAAEGTDPNFGKCWVIQKAPTLTVGETYTVIYNGVAYDCVCYSGDDSGLSFAKGGFLMGNFSVVGGANTGEPFAMVIFPSYQMIMNLDLTGATSVKFGIMGEVVHKMDDKFLPDDVARVFTVKAVTGSYTDDGWEVSIDKTFEEIRTHAKDGNTIVRILRVDDEGNSDILPLQFCYDDVATFSMTAISEFKHRTTQTIWVKPDDTALLYVGEGTV